MPHRSSFPSRSGPGALKNCVPSLGQGETTFQDCTLSAPGQYTLIANDTDGAVHLTSQASNPFTITQGTPVKLVFATSPGNGTGGLPFSTQPVVDIEDSSDNVVYGDDNTVTLAIDNNPGGGTLSTCSVPAVNGIATFTGCSIDKIGNGYTLTANDGADGLPTSLPSLPFNITAGPAAQLAFTTSPGTTVVGDPLVPTRRLPSRMRAAISRRRTWARCPLVSEPVLLAAQSRAAARQSVGPR